MEKSHFLTVILLFSLALAMVSAGTKCEDGWTFFQRPSRGVCLKFFTPAMIAPHVCLDKCTYSHVEERCKKVGASLAGIQNEAESNWINAKSIDNVWMAAKRVPNTYEFVTTDPYIDGKGWLDIPMVNGKPEGTFKAECLKHTRGKARTHVCSTWLPWHVCVKLAT